MNTGLFPFLILFAVNEREMPIIAWVTGNVGSCNKCNKL